MEYLRITTDQQSGCSICVGQRAVFVSIGLSELSVWWLCLGIQIERIAPDHPEQNGRHDRTHLTLKTEADPFPGAAM